MRIERRKRTTLTFCNCPVIRLYQDMGKTMLDPCGPIVRYQTTFRKNIRAESEVWFPVLFLRTPLEVRLSRELRLRSNMCRIRKIWGSEPKTRRTSMQQTKPHQQRGQEVLELLISCAILKSEWQATNHVMSTSTTPQLPTQAAETTARMRHVLLPSNSLRFEAINACALIRKAANSSANKTGR
jgi:hypothetical protein